LTAYPCNPSYLGGCDQDPISKITRAKGTLDTCFASTKLSLNTSPVPPTPPQKKGKALALKDHLLIFNIYNHTLKYVSPVGYFVWKRLHILLFPPLLLMEENSRLPFQLVHIILPSRCFEPIIYQEVPMASMTGYFRIPSLKGKSH
jgi:hypothetical protein